MTIKIRVRDDLWGLVKKELDQSLKDGHHEWGILGTVRKISCESYLLAQAVPAGKGDIDCSRGSLRFSATYIRKVQLLAKSNGDSGLAFFHTHPFSRRSVAFSSYDDSEEPGLIENLRDAWPGSQHLSVVAGKDAMMARMYVDGQDSLPVSLLFVVGRNIVAIDPSGKPAVKPKVEALFSRAEAVTGVGALHTLSQMKIAVIGAGGTGSLMIELLRRAGAKNLCVIDDDHVDGTNLNRLLHATRMDALECRKKVFVAAAANHWTGIGCSMTVMAESIITQSAQDFLRSMDLLVGCVDRETPRFILNKLAIEGGIPYVDLGAEIGAKENLQSLDARVTYVYPGGPCLICRGLINFDDMRLEGFQSDERRRHINMGYNRDIDIKQPAVMELNMRAASLASLYIRHLIQPYFDDSVGADLREAVLTLKSKQPPPKNASSVACIHCGYAEKR